MTVSFAIVAYNEEKTLHRLLEDLKKQDYPHERIEVLLIDSMSADGTRAIMEQFQQENTDFLRVLALDNPASTLACGCNVMLEHYTGDAVVRIDAHAEISRDFISKNVEVLEQGGCRGLPPKSQLSHANSFTRKPMPGSFLFYNFLPGKPR